VTPARPVAPRLTGGVIAVAVLLLLVLGVYPSPAVRWARESTLPMTPGRALSGPAAMQALAPTESLSVLP
jgi:hypothetical protein